MKKPRSARLRGMTFFIAFFRPFVALAVLAFVCWPVKRAVEVYLPEGRLKRLLLLRLTNR